MDDFVDYYEFMQISPSAEPQTVQRVYRLLASRYHPDNPETGNMEKFVLLQEAYRVLSDPEARARYDTDCSMQRAQPMPIFELKEFIVGIEAEVNRRLGTLCLLYNQRRSTPDNPGMSLLDLEGKMSLPREHLEFTVWYLRDKGFVRRDDSTADMIITSAGVDFVESNRPANRIVYKLLKSGEEGRTSKAGEEPAQ